MTKAWFLSVVSMITAQDSGKLLSPIRYRQIVRIYITILKDFRNAPPAKLLIYCQNVIF